MTGAGKGSKPHFHQETRLLNSSPHRSACQSKLHRSITPKKSRLDCRCAGALARRPGREAFGARTEWAARTRWPETRHLAPPGPSCRLSFCRAISGTAEEVVAV